MKKGFTLMELIVSVVMIAIVMIFLVRLLVDLRYDATNELYDTANQINRAEIIKTIQKDIKDKTIIEITDDDSTSDKLIINLKISDNISGTIEVNEKNELIYTDTSKIIRKWALEKNNKKTYIQKINIKCDIIKANNNDDCLIVINIPVIVDDSKKDKDSQMDNIILTFYQKNNPSNLETSILNGNQ